MQTWLTIVEAVIFDTTLGEVFGPYGAMAFLALVATIVIAALVVAARGIVEQIRGPQPTTTRAAAAHRTEQEESPTPLPAA